MVLKNVFTVIVCTTLLASPAWRWLASIVDQFLGLDLSKAVLSPMLIQLNPLTQCNKQLSK